MTIICPKGTFVHNGEEIDNTIVGEGWQLMLQSMFQAGAVLPTNFYLGLTSANLNYNSVLADATAGEPVGNGYARQPLVRSGSGWTVELVNGLYRARSANVTFTASANWASTYSRMFLANVVSGAGKLFAASGPSPSPISVLSGAGPVCSYILNLQG